jgi:sugar lactone lactonase YvrE
MNDTRTNNLGSLERGISTWMTDEVGTSPVTPEAEINRILTATSHVRPDPRWLALLKEPAMRTPSTGDARVAVGLPARGLVIALMVLGLVTLMLASALVGARLLNTSSVVAPPPNQVVSSSPGPSNPAPSNAVAVSPAEFAWRASGPGQDWTPGHNLDFDAQGRIWTADPKHDRFAIFKTDGAFVEYWGESGTAQGQFDLQRANGDGYGGIAFETDGSFFVLDVGNHRVQAFDASRAFVRAWGHEGAGSAEYMDPVGIAVAPDGTLWILDDDRQIVEHYDRNGLVLGAIPMLSNPSESSLTGGSENNSNGLAIDADGNLYYGQIEANRVVKVDAAGALLQVFGDTIGFGRFSDQPGQIAIDARGYVFVTHGGPQRGGKPGIMVFQPDGTYLTGFGSVGTADGQLTFPDGIVLDGRGNLYVADALAIQAGTSARGAIELFRLNPPLTP